MEAGEMYTALRTMFTIKKSVESRNKRPSAMTQKTDSFSRTQLLLSPFEMLEDGYPLPISSDSKYVLISFSSFNLLIILRWIRMI